jgi:hypothetical protein
MLKEMKLENEEDEPITSIRVKKLQKFEIEILEELSNALELSLTLALQI